MSLLLLMLRLPAAPAERASALTDMLARDYGLRNFAYDATRLHITLFNLGQEVSAERVALVERIAPRVTASPFEVEFASCRGPTPWCCLATTNPRHSPTFAAHFAQP